MTLTTTSVRPVGFRPWEISATINTEVVTQHAEDAAFLWLSWDRAIRAPNYNLKDLLRLDERVEANIDGLRVAGATGWELAAREVVQELPGELFVAAVLAFETKETERINSVLELSLDDFATVRPLVSALAWVHFEEVRSTLEYLIRSERPEYRSLAIAGYAAHRIDPGELLRISVSDAHPMLQSCALRAAGELGRTDLAHIIVRFISASEPACRFFASWSSARLGIRDSDILSSLRSIAESEDSYSELAMQMALRCMGLDEARNWLSTFLKDPRLLRRGLIGIGTLGDPAQVTELIDYMQLEEVSRVAGESFSMITGIDLKHFDLDQPKPNDFEAGPSDDPADTDVVLDADEDLPWPSTKLVRKWWNEHAREYRPGIRYLNGELIESTCLMNVLKSGHQRQREAAAMELGLLYPSEILFNTHARAQRQLKRVALWSS